MFVHVVNGSGKREKNNEEKADSYGMGDKSKNVRGTMVEDTINNREMEQESKKEQVLRK